MIHRDEFLHSHPEFHPGMTAYSTDGEPLGQLQLLDEDSATILKGEFFEEDFTISYDNVADIREDHVIINQSRADLEEQRARAHAGAEERRRTGTEAEAGVSGYEYEFTGGMDQRTSNSPPEKGEKEQRKETRAKEQDAGAADEPADEDW